MLHFLYFSLFYTVNIREKNQKVYGERCIHGRTPVNRRCLMEHIYDVIIIGGGPGGYTAALYAARAGLDVLLLEKLSAGGQMALSHQIDNYPGFAEGIDGFTLAEQMQAGAERFGVKSELAEVYSAELDGIVKKLETGVGTVYGKTVVISTGAAPRELGLEREQGLVGRGVHYCAACDGMFFRGKTVAVAGGGNSAASDALLLSRICEKVYVIHRRDTLRATKIYHEPLMQAENVEFCWDSVVEELHYADGFRGLRLKNVKTEEEKTLSVDGIFVSIGRKPVTDFLSGQLVLDAAGYIVADETTRTNLPGVFAVGDVRTKALRQVVTAVADGATASHYIEEYLAEQK